MKTNSKTQLEEQAILNHLYALIGHDIYKLKSISKELDSLPSYKPFCGELRQAASPLYDFGIIINQIEVGQVKVNTGLYCLQFRVIINGEMRYSKKLETSRHNHQKQ